MQLKLFHKYVRKLQGPGLHTNQEYDSQDHDILQQDLHNLTSWARD